MQGKKKQTDTGFKHIEQGQYLNYSKLDKPVFLVTLHNIAFECFTTL